MPDHRNTEADLVRGCIRNERKSQELLYRRYFEGMFRLCMRYAVDEQEAMDILNAGFLKVFKKIDTFETKGSLEGWIRQVIFNTLRDHFRLRRNKVRFLELEKRDMPVGEGALENLYLEDILRLTESLPGMGKEVFRLYAIEGYNHREIGELLQISEGTSKWHLHHARKQLKQLLKNTNQAKNHAG